MSGNKSVLIVTDGTHQVKKMAEDIAAALRGSKVLLKDASSFTGTDLLPANVLFFGCEEPSPPSFEYIEDLLQHINLAGRSIGIFSSGSMNAVQYLARMVRYSEASLNPEPFVAENYQDIDKWTNITFMCKY